MSADILVLWRRPDGTRCVVSHDGRGGWQLRVTRDDEQLLAEHYTSAPDLFARAQQLRDLRTLRRREADRSSAQGT